MLAYVPVAFAVYSPLKAHLRWTLMNLVSFADRGGKCFPSVRKLAEVTGVSKSTVSRHLIELSRIGIVTRQRRPGGGYEYRLDSRFLPAARGVSHKRDRAVPPVRTEEKTFKKTSDSDLPDDRVQWRARLRGWEKSRFWLSQWGPTPGERGCFAPPALMATPALT